MYISVFSNLTTSPSRSITKSKTTKNNLWSVFLATPTKVVLYFGIVSSKYQRISVNLSTKTDLAKYTNGN